MITIEEFSKTEFKVAEVKEITKKGIKIVCNNQEFLTSQKLNVKKGDKIIISMHNGMLILPLANGLIPIAPEKDIDIGARVS
jgi:co-chaperonin GroES (HSP10)